MIRVLENYSRVKSADLPVGSGFLSIVTLQEVGTYTISFSYVVHSGEVSSDGFLLYGTSIVARMPPSEGRMSFTFNVGAANVGVAIRIYSSNLNSTAIENHVTFHNIHMARGTQGADIWTPAHADLTPEQIAMMKYGEFKEIKSF